MRGLLLVALACAIAACASASDGPRPGRGVETTIDEASRALELARATVLAEPAKYRSVWGSPLELDRAVARKATWLDEPHRVYWVRIPERSPRGMPVGVELEVDLATGKCRPMEME